MELTALKAARVEIVTVGSGCGSRTVAVASLSFQDKSCGRAPLNMPFMESNASSVLTVTSGAPPSPARLLLHAMSHSQATCGRGYTWLKRSSPEDAICSG